MHRCEGLQAKSANQSTTPPLLLNKHLHLHTKLFLALFLHSCKNLSHMDLLCKVAEALSYEMPAANPCLLPNCKSKRKKARSLSTYAGFDMLSECLSGTCHSKSWMDNFIWDTLLQGVRKTCTRTFLKHHKSEQGWRNLQTSKITNKSQAAPNGSSLAMQIQSSWNLNGT